MNWEHEVAKRTPRRRMGWIFPIVPIVLFAVYVPPAHSQDETGLQTGARVRVTLHGIESAQVTGTIEKMGTDSLRIRIGDSGQGGLETVASREISGIELSTGRHRQTLKGLALGTVIGFGSGAVLGLVSGDDEEACPYRGLERAQRCFVRGLYTYSAGEKAMIAGLGLAVVGGVIGLMVGASSEVERWMTVDVPEGELTIRPAVSGASLGASLQWTSGTR